MQKSFLGTGWSFPPTVREKNRALDMVSDEADIQQSLFLLISTTPGERIMFPEFGCDLQRLVFERINEALRFEMIALVNKAIYLFEPRVKVENTTVHIESIDPGIIHIHVEYTVIQTNSRANIVYPFYLQEGTSVVL
jgi:uncharacterized protein